MHARNLFQQFCLILGTISMAMPLGNYVLAVEAQSGDLNTNSAVPEVFDVALNANHQLAGQVLDEQGHPVSGAIVGVLDASGVWTSTVADEEGAFAADVARGGVYQLSLGDDITVCRVWSEAGPPTALDRVLLVTGDVERARRYPLLPQSPATQFLSNPWVISGLVVTAVVVPIIIHNNRDDRASASGP